MLKPGARIRSDYLRNVFFRGGIKGYIHYFEGFVAPMGRARERLSSNSFVHQNDDVEKSCQDAGKTIVILPDGKITFCCGHTIFTQAQDYFVVDNLALGGSLADVIDRMQRNVFPWMLHIEGPEATHTCITKKRDF